MAAFEQALFGYRNGHQLLASSIPLSSEIARRLGPLTDMAFDGKAPYHLTALPITELKRYALARTWPAPEAPRRGSVWSHVLLIDLVALTEIDRLSALTSLFRRPDADAPDNLSPYRDALRPPDLQPTRSIKQWTTHDAERILWTAYVPDESPVVRADDVTEAEALLLAVWQQQWPRLRRNFAFRTRYRVGSGASAFAVQVVERVERNQRPAEVPSPRPPWLVSLTRDLMLPDEGLRLFLRVYGPQSNDGRRDLPKLVELAAELGQADERSVIQSVASFFPKQTDMPALKAALLGRPTDSRPPRWEVPEPRRLRLLLGAETQAGFDLTNLESRARLAELWRTSRRHARDLLELVEFSDHENTAFRDEVVAVAVAHASPEDLAAVSATNPEVAIVVVRERRELLAEPSLWVGDPALVDHLLDLLDGADEQTRDDILERLLAAAAIEPAGRLVSRTPRLWWRALELVAASSRPEAAQCAATASLLEAVGPGAIGAMPSQISSAALRLLAAAVSPSLGLWRQAKPEAWLAAVEKGELPRDPAASRLLIVLASSAKNASKPDTRRKLWRLTFPSLHDALRHGEIQDDDLRALASMLPLPDGIQERDYAGRLRAALAIEIRRSSWPREEVDQIVQAAAPYEGALRKALAAGKKKKKSWLRELADQLLS